jgi:hypothetical protein
MGMGLPLIVGIVGIVGTYFIDRSQSARYRLGPMQYRSRRH